MYDLAVIGAGWAGFNAALKAKKLGLKVALIEKAQVGGTCLNRGCIPTKALIQSAKIFSLAKKSQNFGIESAAPQVDFLKIQERKDKIIQQLLGNMQSMLKGIDLLSGEAKIISGEELKVGAQSIKTKNILIATGSKPLELKGFKFDGRKIISSDDILGLKEIPKSLLIIGGGVIGSEFASLFSIFGSQVTIAELTPQLLPTEDKEVAKKLEGSFKKKGIKINTSTDAKTLDLNNFDRVLVCVGRVANIEGLEDLGLNLEKGKIQVDEYLKTNIPNIYAAGDCTGRIMLAHFAAYQGEIAAENIANPNNPKKADNQNIPNCIFTDPEIASVGLKESAEAEVNVSKFDFMGSGMARILDETEGFIKIISDKKTDKVIGASIIGPRATELIGILTVAISAGLTVSQLRDTIFAHPTLSEAIGEALK